MAARGGQSRVQHRGDGHLYHRPEGVTRMQSKRQTNMPQQIGLVWERKAEEMSLITYGDPVNVE